MLKREKMTWRKAVLALAGILVGFAVAGSARAATYDNGFIWDRSVDWVAGTVNGSTAGNPGVDSEGTAVWQYEIVQGDGLVGANPWYNGVPTLMSTDTAWFGAQAAWSAGDDVLPVITEKALYHLSNDRFNGAHGVWEDMPMVRWLNPTAETINLAVVGNLTVGWRSVGSASLPIDVVIARSNLTSGTTTPLYSTTVDNPGVNGELVLPISIAAQMAPEDSLIITHRASGLLDGTYIALFDDVQLIKMATITPEPGTLAVLALGGGVALARRKRRRA